MRIVIFCHSLVSDWNHGNAHFLRGICSELLERGHGVRVFEPADGWSRSKLVEQNGEQSVTDFERAFPQLHSEQYELDTLDLDEALDHADLVLVHEWSPPALVKRVGAHRAKTGAYRLLFHDTHHRAATQPQEMARFDLTHYDGVLAFGEVIRRIYLDRGWTERAWTWHEAADTRVFHPLDAAKEADLVWIGNWGDDERSAELRQFLFNPARDLDLSGSIYGVRYPPAGRRQIAAAGLDYRGWIANHLAPRTFAHHRFTVHVPRRPYVQKLPGIPTIRPFEALACGIPLICAPWDDAEHLFRPGEDYLVAEDGDQMRDQMRTLLADPDLAATLRRNGLETIAARHTCAHRIDELMSVCGELAIPDQTEVLA